LLAVSCAVQEMTPSLHADRHRLLVSASWPSRLQLRCPSKAGLRRLRPSSSCQFPPFQAEGTFSVDGEIETPMEIEPRACTHSTHHTRNRSKDCGPGACNRKLICSSMLPVFFSVSCIPLLSSVTPAHSTARLSPAVQMSSPSSVFPSVKTAENLPCSESSPAAKGL
jgi:hypothetical protein